MKSRPKPASTRGSRLRGLAVTASGLGLLAMVCGQLAEMTWSACQTILAPGPATPDQAMAALAGTLALALALWLALGILTSLLAALAGLASGGPSPLASGMGRCADWVAPVIVRNAVAALLGVAIVAVPAVAQAAGPSPAAVSAGQVGAAAHVASGARADARLSPAWMPMRAADQAAAPGSPSVTTSTAAAAANEGVDDRSDGSDSFPDAWSPDARPPDAWPPAKTRSSVAGPYAPPGYSTSPAGGSSGGSPAGSIEAAPGVADDLNPGWVPLRPVPGPRPRTTAAVDPRPALPVARRLPADEADEIVVHRGDTLWGVAARHLGEDASDAEIALEWPHWFTANRAVIGADPDELRPGERLRVPGPGPARGRGDTEGEGGR